MGLGTSPCRTIFFFGNTYISLGYFYNSFAVHQDGGMLQDTAVANNYRAIDKGYRHQYLQSEFKLQLTKWDDFTTLLSWGLKLYAHLV